jgi:hypothetical protein
MTPESRARQQFGKHIPVEANTQQQKGLFSVVHAMRIAMQE